MKIISKYRDYYDSASAYGVDESIIYSRQQSEKEYNQFLNDNNIKNSLFVYRNTYLPLHKEHISCSTVVVGFCGRIYPCLVLKYDSPSSSTSVTSSSPISKYCYSVDDVYTFLHMLPYKVAVKMIDIFEKKDTSLWGRGFTKGNILPMFSLFGATTPAVFRELNAPVFLVKDIKIPLWKEDGSTCNIVVNPVLQDYDFARVKDPYTAHQDIAMYISGVLGVGEPHTLDISDECMRDAKGFDDKSFKTRKGSKKPRRKK